MRLFTRLASALSSKSTYPATEPDPEPKAAHDARLLDLRKGSVDRSEEYMRGSRLRFQLTFVWWCTCMWPRFSRTPDRFGVPLDARDIEGQFNEGEGWVQFRWDDRLYRLQLTHTETHTADPGYVFASLKLAVDGADVLAIIVKKTANDPYHQWRYVSVESLTLGDWVTEFIEFSDLLGLD